MVHLDLAPLRIKGRITVWRGCLWEDSRHKAKKQIIIIIIRILRFWIISSLTESLKLRRIRTQVEPKIMAINRSLEADSLTTLTYRATHLRICKKEVQVIKAINRVLSKFQLPWTSQLAQLTMQRWTRMRITTCLSWQWVQWSLPVVSLRYHQVVKDLLAKP
mgnify:CR=1 FL=1